MIVVDYYTDDKILKELSKIDKVVKTKPNLQIMDGINAHPDLLIRPLNTDTLAVDDENLSYYSSIFKDKKIIPIKNIKSPYPNHVKLNFAIYQNLFIHNLNYTDTEVYQYYHERKYEFIHVKQGYTKCNLVVGKNCLITSDVNIYEKLKSKTKILLIEHKQIKLRGFNYGFIGGTSGIIKDTLYFTGSLDKHSSSEKIIDFLETNNEKYKFITNGELVDIGSIIEI